MISMQQIIYNLIKLKALLNPQSNGCVERFNRTIKEQFVDNNLDVIGNIERFSRIKI